MTDHEWYYMFGGDQSGPVSTDELATKIKSGELDSDVLVWTDGMSDFTIALSVPEIATMITVESESVLDEIQKYNEDVSTKINNELQIYSEVISIAMSDGKISPKGNAFR